MSLSREIALPAVAAAAAAAAAAAGWDSGGRGRGGVVPLVLGEGGTEGRRRGREVEEEEEGEEEEGKGEGEPRMCLNSPRRRACSYWGRRAEERRGREGGRGEKKKCSRLASSLFKKRKMSVPPSLPPARPPFPPFVLAPACPYSRLLRPLPREGKAWLLALEREGRHCLLLRLEYV